MTIDDFEPNSRGSHLQTVLRRVSGPVQAARQGAAALVARAPQAVESARSGAHATTSTLQRLPDSTLRSIATSSVGVGAGLYLSGKRRLGIAAGVGSALVIGAAIASRPVEPTMPDGQPS
jgi:hypothetical protein